MKLYYQEHGIFPSTYSFKDDIIGGTPTGFTVDESGGTVSLISDLDGHRRVMDLHDTDGGNIVYLHQTLSASQTYGTIEFLMRTDDATKDGCHFIMWDGATRVLLFSLRGSDFDYLSAGWHEILDGASSNIWYHIRIDFECTGGGYKGLAQFKWDVYINGIQYGPLPFENDESEVDKMTWQTEGVANGWHFYVDAIGYSWDTDYTIGDNLNVDWHDPYNKERITDIVEYPIIVPRLNMYAMCNATVGDYEGAKFDDWYARDFNKILIEDDSDNIIFRGFLIEKTFTKESLTLYFAGIGALLDYTRFGDMGVMNYILAYGLVAAPIPATSILTLKDDNGDPMGWDADWWIAEGKDVGILIVDKTDVNTRTWDSSAIAQVGGAVQAGNNASTLLFSEIPADYYNVRDTTVGNPDLIISSTVDGVVVADTDFLKSIEIQYSFRMKIVAGIFARNYAKCKFQILKDTTWFTIAKIDFDRYAGSHTSAWKMGIPSDEHPGGNDDERLIEDTDTELRKFFNKDNGNYSELKGLRFILSGDIKTDGYVEVHVDFIKVKVGYHSDDVSPIMEQIDDSAASTVTCNDIAKWDETGVVENDGFKIGQNTGVVLQDIATTIGIDINSEISVGGGGTFTLRPNGDGAQTEWAHTDSGGDGNHYKDVDEVVVDPNAGDGNLVWTGSLGVQKQDEFDFETDVMGGNNVGKKIDLYTYGQRDTVNCNLTLQFYTTTTGWSAVRVPQHPIGSYGWKKSTWDGLLLSQADLDSLQIRLNGDGIDMMGENMRIDTIYVVVTYDEAYSFSKFMAREFKGAYCMEPLKAVCKLEGLHWYEDYINNKLVVRKPTELLDSGVDLTEEDYDEDWEYEDNCNQIKSFFVFGKSEDNIIAKAIDETVESPISKHIIDEAITNIADAQIIADDNLTLLKTKRPLIKLPLKEDNVDLQLGRTVDVTFSRPTIAQATYPIRKLERKQKGLDDIKLTIWIGLGESTAEENVAKFIRDNMFRSHKGLTNKLISP